jgi:hypothetical protein
LNSFSNTDIEFIKKDYNFNIKEWGYIDKTGEMKIVPQFDYADEFSEGYACIKKGDVYGYINKNGVLVIEPQFHEAYAFRQRVARVRINGENSFIRDTATRINLGNEYLLFDVQPSNINGRLLVPLRAIFEHMGAVVEWDENTNTIRAFKGSEVSIEIQIDSKIAKVEWDDDKKTATINPQ